jgi:hypothetical protein
MALLACGTSLPAQRPADFSVTVSWSAGMLPSMWEKTCSATGCTWTLTEIGKATSDTRPVSQAQLDALYAVVRNAAFDSIKVHEHSVAFDKGTDAVSVTAAGKTYEAGFSVGADIAHGDVPRHEAVKNATEALVQAVGGPGASAP